jgi:CSLREA domain-containing protein
VAGNRIGGAGAEANVIANNVGDGVRIADTAGSNNAVLGNSIYNNGGLGIDLDLDGVTANGAGDPLDYPVMTSAVETAGTVVVDFDLDVPAGNYRIEFFDNTVGDGSGYGEGETFVHAYDVVGHSGGSASYSTSFAGSAGDILTSTTTEDVGASYGSTSEFSAGIGVGPVTLSVNSTGDASDISPGNGVCDTGNTNSQGATECTLRAAIEEANALAGTDTINFNMPSTEAGYSATPLSYTIQAGSAGGLNLPAITGPVVIDGTTQPDFAGTPIIVIDSTLGGSSDPNGLTLQAGDSTIRGLVIINSGDDGIELEIAGGNTIVGNYIGVGVDGVTAAGNGWGISVKSDGNLVGGSLVADRNVISGNTNHGITIYDAAGDNEIEGNFVGVGFDGSTAVPNGVEGIRIDAASAGTIITDNVISANGDDGIEIASVGADGTIMRGNLIGVASDGTTARPNSRYGIVVYNGPANTQIGGTGAGEGNVISSNPGGGIVIDGNGVASTSGTMIQGNFIGTNASSTLNLGNGADGIYLRRGANSSTIGGTTAAAENTIVYNLTDGIAIVDNASVDNAILRNKIHSNTGLGIDLNDDSVSNNDVLDGDSGGNNRLNYPVMISATEWTGAVLAKFDLDVPVGFYRIDLYTNPSGTDPSNNGEGESHWTSTIISHPGGGVQTFSTSAAGSTGDVITMTATECTDGAGCAAWGDTSEYSLAATVVANSAPTADAAGPYTIAEGASVTLNGSGSTDPEDETLTYAWDLNNDLTFGDVTGVGPTVDWATLQSFGIVDDGTHTIGLQVDDGRGGLNATTATLTVTNTQPTISTTGAATATPGVAYTLNLSVTDPGADTVTSWIINWGDGTIQTIAGNPASVTHTYGFTGLSYGITASVIDEDGTFHQNQLLVAAFNSDAINRFERTTGAPLGQFGSLDGPDTAVIGPDGLLYVSAYNIDTVNRYNANSGVFVDTFVTVQSGGLDGPSDLTFGPDGNLYVASDKTHQVLRYNGSTGAYIDAFVPAGSGGLDGVRGLAFGEDRQLYVSSFNTDAVLRYDGATGAFLDTFVSIASGGLDQPEELVFGPDGNLYVASFATDQVLRYNGSTGVFIDFFATGGVPTALDGPVGIVFGPDGHLYVSSSLNDRIFRFNGSTGAFIDEFVTNQSGGMDNPQIATFSPGKIVTSSNARPTAIDGGPYAIAEGDSLVLDGSGSLDPNGDPLTYSWDLDNDGTFDDASGVNPTVDWATLQAVGIDDDAVYPVALQVDDGSNGIHTDATTLTVSNTQPTISTSGTGTTDAGTPYTLNLSVTDPGDDTVTSWIINWGDGSIDTIAGNPASTNHTYPGTGLTYNVTASVVDEDGTFHQNQLVVAGLSADALFRYERTTAGPLGTFGTIDAPHGVTVGPDGYLYVSGFNADAVQRFDAGTGAFVDTFVTVGLGGLNEATGLAFLPNGDLLVASRATDRVLRYDGTTGAYLGEFITNQSGGLDQPQGMTFGADGNLYVVSQATKEVLRFSGGSGTFMDVFVTASSGGLNQPRDLVFGPDGNLYVASYEIDQVLRYNGTTGAFIDSFVTNGSGGLNQPIGLAFGPDGFLYVGSFATDQILRYNGSTGAYVDVYVTVASGGLDQPMFFSFIPGHQVDGTNVNPVFDQDLGDRSDAEGTYVSLSASATHANPLTYSATGLPLGLSIDSGTGLISGVINHAAAAASPYTVILSVTDGYGSDTDTFTWTVTNVLASVPFVVAGSGGAGGGDDWLSAVDETDFSAASNEASIGGRDRHEFDRGDCGASDFGGGVWGGWRPVRNSRYRFGCV